MRKLMLLSMAIFVMACQENQTQITPAQPQALSDLIEILETNENGVKYTYKASDLEKIRSLAGQPFLAGKTSYQVAVVERDVEVADANGRAQTHRLPSVLLSPKPTMATGSLPVGMVSCLAMLHIWGGRPYRRHPDTRVFVDSRRGNKNQLTQASVSEQSPDNRWMTGVSEIREGNIQIASGQYVAGNDVTDNKTCVGDQRGTVNTAYSPGFVDTTVRIFCN